ncbi:hypothetical protein ACFL6N_06545 [Thermodesulfobacteriota bacterium]
MNTDLKRKMLMGIGEFMVPVPQMIASTGLKKGVAGAGAKAELLSPEERKIHLFIVGRMTESKIPLTAKQVAADLDLPVDVVEAVIEKLEGLKTFLYRSDGKVINWAYPISREDTGHKMTDSTGEQFFAA